jgi:hypothetical protein
MSYYALFFLGLFLVLFGVFSVTNFEMTWGKPIMGYSSFVAGVLIIWWAALEYNTRKKK